MPTRRTTRNQRRERRGAAAIEAAIVLPIVLLFTIGLMIGILGVFRYNQISSLAGEAARWAAVRGRNYEKIHGARPITSDDVWQSVVKPRAAGLELGALRCDLIWSVNQSVVSVKVTYQWLPEAFFGARTLSCSSTSVVAN